MGYCIRKGISVAGVRRLFACFIGYIVVLTRIAILAFVDGMTEALMMILVYPREFILFLYGCSNMDSTRMCVQLHQNTMLRSTRQAAHLACMLCSPIL